MCGVSIQPKPKTGLEATLKNSQYWLIDCFNPAEAEDGFRRNFEKYSDFKLFVSIQPKPKTGLEVKAKLWFSDSTSVSIQPKPKTGLEVASWYNDSDEDMFQSSRSRRRV